MPRKHKTDKAQRQAQASGKLANDHNQMGSQAPSQKNEGRRTPASRSDRDTQVGTDNQSRTRQGGPGTPSGGKSR
jgi:hypothetical protein